MSRLSDNQRNNLTNIQFGIPELRKYPLNNKNHVIKAIQMFHHCPIEYKQELAHNINKNAKRFDIHIDVKSPIYQYLNETEQLNISMFEEIDLLEDSLYILNEGIFSMSEQEARNCVNTAISLWNKRKSLIKNNNDKRLLTNDVKSEKVAISTMQERGDYNGILMRAKSTSRSMNLKLLSDKKYVPLKNKNASSSIIHGNNGRKMVGFMAGATILGSKIGKNVAGNHAVQKQINKTVKQNVQNNRPITYNSKPPKKATGAKIAGGAAGAALGAAVGGMAIVANGIRNNSNYNKAKDPNKAYKQIAEKYVNFINSYQSEILEIVPEKELNKKNNMQQDNQGDETNG